MALWGRKATSTESDADLLAGIALYDQDRFSEAIGPLRLAANRNIGFAAFKLANCLSNLGQERAAVSYWKKAIALGNKESLTNLGIRYADLGFPDVALAMYREAAANGSDDAMHAAGIIELEAGNFVEFLSWMKQAAGAGNIRAYANWGAELFEAGQIAEGLEILDRGIAAGSISCLIKRAQISFSQNQISEAITYLEEGLALENIEGRETHMVKYLKNLLGVYLVQNEEFDKALPFLQEAADAGDQNAADLLRELESQTTKRSASTDLIKTTFEKTPKRETLVPEQRNNPLPGYKPTLLGHF